MKPTPKSSLVARLFLISIICGALSSQSVYAQRRTQTRRTPPAPAQKTEAQKTGARKIEAPAASDNAQGSPQARQVTSSILIRWQGTQGVERYRLQVARDAQFEDIVFDQAVVGREYRITGLAAGNYFWRVAPAAGETGRYTRGAPVEVSAADASVASIPAGANVVVASNNAGWRTATGEVMRLVTARLRADKGADLVGVNADGTVYALDGTTGVALWTTRFRPNAKRGEATGSSSAVTFAPLITPARDGLSSNIVVAFDAGVRALTGDTGREAWRTQLPAGAATGGVAADLNGDGKNELAVVAGSPSTLYILEGDTGLVSAETKLGATVVGAPVPYTIGDARAVALALDNSSVEVRSAKGETVRSVKFEGTVTTAPLIVTTGLGVIMTVGTDKGLDALAAAELKPLGRIVTENDTVRGTLAAIDLDSDGTSEIVMVTKLGRVAVVGTNDGKIKWFAEGATDAGAASFADLNGDGTLDVIVPAGSMFALGFSGRDGSLIWRTEEEARTAASASASAPGGASSMRALTVAPASGDSVFLVGGEPSRVGLRAVELPKGAFRSAGR
ncbi:MAG TPA: FG-GAP-like repeat-containing protein [Pyrinomonadaceae bacterium]|jgi:outer membrane protein assembly factor BamB